MNTLVKIFLIIIAVVIGIVIATVAYQMWWVSEVTKGVSDAMSPESLDELARNYALCGKEKC